MTDSATPAAKDGRISEPPLAAVILWILGIGLTVLSAGSLAWAQLGEHGLTRDGALALAGAVCGGALMVAAWLCSQISRIVGYLARADERATGRPPGYE